ncbi:hypothetical protein E2C01_088950 [Portunus trituberculatus]|uniref:Uncharacterized protein n=1 Tax=Portunus trituberculatus TaxID=210409 RepID=A0A5B7JL76_PORTR|nr:hypothetical protein [Portunus trituberculatus]
MRPRPSSPQMVCGRGAGAVERQWKGGGRDVDASSHSTHSLAITTTITINIVHYLKNVVTKISRSTSHRVAKTQHLHYHNPPCEPPYITLYKYQETHVGIKMVKTVAINLLTSIDLLMSTKSSNHT